MKWYLNNLAELVCLLIAIIYYPYLKGTFMRWVLPFMIVIFFGEFYAKYQADVLKVSNVKIYYLISVVQSLFYGFVFYKMNDSWIIKKIIFSFVLISITCYLISLLFFFDVKRLLYIELIFSGLIFSFISLLYLYMRFVSETQSYLIQEPGFWIAFGVSLFFSGVSISFSLHDFIIDKNLELFGKKLHHLVPQALSVVLYLGLSIAIFLCKKKSRITV